MSPLVLPAQTLQDDCNRPGPGLGIASSAVPWSTFDLIGSTNLLKLLSDQLGATHPSESAVLTLDRGPDCSLGAVITALPDVGSTLTLVLRQRPSVSWGYGGYHLEITRTDTDTFAWVIARRDPQQVPAPLGDPIADGPALEPGCWVGAQADGDTIGGWFVPAADVTYDGDAATFDTADAQLVLEREDGNYSLPGTYAIVLGDATVRLDCITGSGTVVLPDPPTSLTLPSLVGAAHTGNTLTCNPGTWASVVDAIAYQWLRNGDELAGETGASYTLVGDDEDQQIACRVTASNAGGSGDAQTAPLTCTRATFGQPWVHTGDTWRPMHARRS
jgi:hypothetical protein